MFPLLPFVSMYTSPVDESTSTKGIASFSFPPIESALDSVSFGFQLSGTAPTVE